MSVTWPTDNIDRKHMTIFFDTVFPHKRYSDPYGPIYYYATQLLKCELSCTFMLVLILFIDVTETNTLQPY